MKMLYTRKEACNQLGIGLTKLHELINDGLLDARKMGRKTVITHASMEALASRLLKAA